MVDIKITRNVQPDITTATGRSDRVIQRQIPVNKLKHHITGTTGNQRSPQGNQIIRFPDKQTTARTLGRRRRIARLNPRYTGLKITVRRPDTLTGRQHHGRRTTVQGIGTGKVTNHPDSARSIIISIGRQRDAGRRMQCRQIKMPVRRQFNLPRNRSTGAGIQQTVTRHPDIASGGQSNHPAPSLQSGALNKVLITGGQRQSARR